MTHGSASLRPLKNRSVRLGAKRSEPSAKAFIPAGVSAELPFHVRNPQIQVAAMKKVERSLDQTTLEQGVVQQRSLVGQRRRLALEAANSSDHVVDPFILPVGEIHTFKSVPNKTARRRWDWVQRGIDVGLAQNNPVIFNESQANQMIKLEVIVVRYLFSHPLQ